MPDTRDHVWVFGGDHSPWVQSVLLGQFGFSKVDEADQRALQRIFGAGALQRTVNPWEFWDKWSELRDGHASLGRRLFNHLLRPSSSLSGSAERTSVRRNSSA